MINLKSMLKSAVVFCFIFTTQIVWAVELPAVPNPFRYVNDYTDTLSQAERQALENKLIAYGKETSSQIAVAIVPTTGDYDISQYSFDLMNKWGVGRKEQKNGVLMVVAKDDRKIFIATGQGLEGALPDVLLSRIIRNVITPEFKQNRYAQGISDGLDHIIRASQGEFAAEPQEQTIEDFIPFVLIVIFILVALFGELSSRDKPYVSPTSNHVLNEVMRQTIVRRRNNRGGFGGGFGGGGFGGGSSDGGGAGGSW